MGGTSYGTFTTGGAGGGGSGGVTSLNSETGDISITSVDSSVTVVAAGQTVDLSAQKLALGNLTDAGTDGITVTSGTGAVVGSGTSIAQHVADTTHNGYLSSTDWNTFNGKQASLTIGNLTDGGTDGITVTGGTGAVIGSGASLSQHVADTTHNGYLSSTDWNTFNGKQAALTIGNLTDAGTDGITVTSGTGAVIGSGTSIAQHVADTTHNGYLSSTDWNTFNGKQAALTIGNLTDTGTDGITVTSGTGAVIGSGTSIAQHVADTTHNGYLSSTDWNTFNGKGAGTVTSVAMTVPTLLSVSGTPVTGSGTLALTYSGTALPVVNGGTGQTSYTDGQLLIGNSSGNTLAKATISAGTGISVTNGNGTISIANTAQSPRARFRAVPSGTVGGSSSGDTVIANFGTPIVNTGGNITYTARTLTTADFFTISADGIYSVTFTAYATAGAPDYGVTLNDTQTSTTLDSMSTAAQVLCSFNTNSANGQGSCSWTGFLSNGDVIRAKAGSNISSATARGQISICQVNS